jgi:hypothetical protein
MGNEYNVNKKGGGISFLDNKMTWVFITGESSLLRNKQTSSPELTLAHELACHAIPAIISPSLYDPRFDGLAVTAENIIRSETCIELRKWGDYEKTDWSVGGITTTLSNLYLRMLFPAIKF